MKVACAPSREFKCAQVTARLDSDGQAFQTVTPYKLLPSLSEKNRVYGAAMAASRACLNLTVIDRSVRRVRGQHQVLTLLQIDV